MYTVQTEQLTMKQRIPNSQEFQIFLEQESNGTDAVPTGDTSFLDDRNELKIVECPLYTQENSTLEVNFCTKW